MGASAIDARGLVRAALAAAVVTAVVLAVVVVETTTRSGVSWRLVTFTYQANLLAAAFYTASLVWPGVSRSSGLRGAVVVYVLLAGAVWNVFLTGHSMGYTPANVLLHVVVPVAAVAEWLVSARRQTPVRWWHPLVWLIYPAVYGAVALLVLNHAGRRAPYYFLDPAAVGVPIVTGNVAALGAVILALGYGVAALGRAASRRTGETR